jgi:hypothetical protein
MKRCLVLTMCFLLPAALGLADGDGPARKMTGPEAAAFNALKNAFQSALPKPPANYAIEIRSGKDSGEMMLPEAIKPDQMARMSFTATYTLSREFQEGQQRASFTDRAKGTPEQQARLTALDAKDAELTRARDHTRDRGEKERIRAELKAVRDEGNKLREQVMADYQAWVASGGATAALQNADKALPSTTRPHHTNFRDSRWPLSRATAARTTTPAVLRSSSGSSRRRNGSAGTRAITYATQTSVCPRSPAAWRSSSPGRRKSRRACVTSWGRSTWRN